MRRIYITIGDKTTYCGKDTDCLPENSSDCRVLRETKEDEDELQSKQKQIQIDLEQMKAGLKAQPIGWECSDVYLGTEARGVFVGVRRPTLSFVARKKMDTGTASARLKCEIDSPRRSIYNRGENLGT